MGVATHTSWDFPALLRLERARLLELCRDLSPDEWNRPTICPGWTVADIVAHLVGDDLGYLSWIRDGHRGTNPPPGTSPTGFIDWLDELQAGWVSAARRISPRLSLELLAWLDEPVAAAMASQDPAQPEAHVSWAQDEPVPNWLDHARELSERWLHRQQLLDALGHHSDDRQDLLEPVLDGLRWSLPHGLAEADAGHGATVVAEVGALRRWSLRRDTTGWQFVDDVPGAASAVVMGSVDAWWRHLTNNRLPSTTTLHAAGEPTLIQALWSTRSIIGHPG